MTVAAPMALGIAAAAALAAIALHFIATRRPPPTPFPTARFIDDEQARAARRAVHPSDLWLLMLRVLALLALGAGFAGLRPAPSWHARRLWLVDRSRAVESMDQVRRAMAAAPGDVLVLFDSTAREVPFDSLRTATRVDVRGSLSAALAAALRAGARLDVRAESLAVVVVSPSAVEAVDSATALLRASVRGTVRWIKVDAATARPTERRTVAAPNARDSAWTRAGDRVLVWWPADSAPVAAHAVSTEGTTLVAPLGRLPVGDGMTVARWEDGAPAVVERVMGRGCVREVGVRAPRAGDVQLSAAYRAFDATLDVSCGNARFDVDSAWLHPVRRVDPVVATVDDAAPSTPWDRWLLALGMVLLVAELFVRRRRVA